MVFVLGLVLDRNQAVSFLLWNESFLSSNVYIPFLVGRVSIPMEPLQILTSSRWPNVQAARMLKRPLQRIITRVTTTCLLHGTNVAVVRGDTPPYMSYYLSQPLFLMFYRDLEHVQHPCRPLRRD